MLDGMSWRAVLGLAFALSLVAGCGLERSPIEQAVDGGGRDAGVVGLDAPRVDVGPVDGGPFDGGSDGGPIDVGDFDAGPPTIDAPITPIDTGVDAPIAPIDVGVDAPIFDAGTDAPAPVDAGTDAPPPPRGCNALYGASPGYQLCSETVALCTFYYDPPPGETRSCNSVCSAGGGVCTGALDEGGSSNRCATSGTSTCGTNEFDGVCVCTRIP